MVLIAGLLGLVVIMGLLGWLISRSAEEGEKREKSEDLPIYEEHADDD